MKIKAFAVLAAIVGSIIAQSPAQAVRYEYTGSTINYNFVFGAAPGQRPVHLSGYFETSVALEENTTYDFTGPNSVLLTGLDFYANNLHIPTRICCAFDAFTVTTGAFGSANPFVKWLVKYDVGQIWATFADGTNGSTGPYNSGDELRVSRPPSTNPSIVIDHNVGNGSGFTSATGNWTGALAAPLAPPSTVPVPAALPLFGTGLALMGFIGWRRKRKLA